VSTSPGSNEKDAVIRWGLSQSVSLPGREGTEQGGGQVEKGVYSEKITSKNTRLSRAQNEGGDCRNTRPAAPFKDTVRWWRVSSPLKNESSGSC